MSSEREGKREESSSMTDQEKKEMPVPEIVPKPEKDDGVERGAQSQKEAADPIAGDAQTPSVTDPSTSEKKKKKSTYLPIDEEFISSLPTINPEDPIVFQLAFTAFAYVLGMFMTKKKREWAKEKKKAEKEKEEAEKENETEEQN